MNPSSLPLNQQVVLAQTEIFRTTIKRTSAEAVEIAYYDQATNDCVLLFAGQMDGLASEIVSWDTTWWTISVDGRPATSTDLEDIARKRGLRIQVGGPTRSIGISTR